MWLHGKDLNVQLNSSQILNWMNLSKYFHPKIKWKKNKINAKCLKKMKLGFGRLRFILFFLYIYILTLFSWQLHRSLTIMHLYCYSNSSFHITLIQIFFTALQLGKLQFLNHYLQYILMSVQFIQLWCINKI